MLGLRVELHLIKNPKQRATIKTQTFKTLPSFTLDIKEHVINKLKQR